MGAKIELQIALWISKFVESTSNWKGPGTFCLLWHLKDRMSGAKALQVGPRRVEKWDQDALKIRVNLSTF